MISTPPKVGTLLAIRSLSGATYGHYLVIGEIRWAPQIGICEIPMFCLRTQKNDNFHVPFGTNAENEKVLINNSFEVVSEP